MECCGLPQALQLYCAVMGCAGKATREPGRDCTASCHVPAGSEERMLRRGCPYAVLAVSGRLAVALGALLRK